MAVTLKVVHGEQIWKENINMQIKINKDLDEIKNGGLYMFNTRQKVTIISAVVIGLLLIFVLNILLGLNAQIAVYMVVFLVLPVAWIGMYQKHGMTYDEYARIKKQTGIHGEYEYKSTECPEEEPEEKQFCFWDFGKRKKVRKNED